MLKLKSIILKCVGCKSRETRAVMPTDMPFCEKCGSPMIVEKVTAR